MTASGQMQVRFRGVRGSMPAASANTLGFGGNTSCVEVCLTGHPSLILDAGSGIHSLGLEWKGQDAHIFLTHFHWDHIGGIPYFSPLYQAGQRITFYAPGSSGPLKPIMEGQMSAPYFPIRLELASAQKEFLEVDSTPITVGPAIIRPFPMHHPQGAFGYRIEAFGSVVVYATDCEHGHPVLDGVLRDYAQNADVLIYDAQYTPEEYESRRGWGHSSWMEATRVANDAKVRKLFLFHHDISRTDLQIQHLVALACERFGNTDGAREGCLFDA